MKVRELCSCWLYARKMFGRTCVCSAISTVKLLFTGRNPISCGDSSKLDLATASMWMINTSCISVQVQLAFMGQVTSDLILLTKVKVY